MRLLFLLFAISLTASTFASAQLSPVTAEELIALSPIIAVVTIDDAPRARIEDAARDPKIFQQRVPAKTVAVIKGSLPKEFRIENEEDSVITAGQLLAFLKHLDKDRYILSSPVSLRRIDKDKVYWFPHTWTPIVEVTKDITP